MPCFTASIRARWAAQALADLLFGKSVPSGKLPVTFPKEVGQIPLVLQSQQHGPSFPGHGDDAAGYPCGSWTDLVG